MQQTAVEGGLVLDAKLVAPASGPSWVERPALAYELERGADARLTLVSAPVGSGKSTLLAQWAAASYERDVAWLTLDRGDDTPALFWVHVVAALRTVRPGFGEQVLRRLQAPSVVVDDDVLTLLADAATDLDSVTLVLDDFHTITDGDVHEGLLYLIERLPPGARVVIATQIDPPLALERLRAQGELFEIRDLGLSADQTAALLRSVLGVPLDRDDVRGVHEWTEGWAAGVHLAALSASGDADPLAFLNNLSANAQNVVDYVWDEVLARQRSEVRRFLAETSILDRFSAPLCAAVTRRDDAEQLLSELERSNAFLVALDAGSRWYRYHQVFRDVLSRELAALAPTAVADLHRRASEWYAAEGFPVEAIEHAVVGGDVQYASDQLIRQWRSVYSEGRGYSLLAWIDRLPPDAVTSDSHLALHAAGLARSLGRQDDAERWLDRIEAHGPLDGDFPGVGCSAQAGVVITRSLLHLARGDLDRALAEAREAEAIEDEHATGKIVISFFLATVLFYADEARSAERLLRRFLADPRTAGRPADRYWALGVLAYIALDRLDVDKARGLAQEALEQAHEHGLEEYPQTAFAHGPMGAALLANGDLDLAEEHLEKAVALIRRGGEGCDIALTLLHLGRLRVRQGDHQAAADALTSARSALEVTGLPRITRLDRELARAVDSAAGDSDGKSPAQELTDTELRIVRLLPKELTYAEIARRLDISMSEVKTHTQHIRRKLEVASRSEAVAAARRRGLL
jgi:LuxR family transcriptional regulator, maltose regulon positive regulatory protein